MNVRVYTKYDEVKLELNGQLIASQSSTSDNKFTYLFSVPYEPGELKAIAVSKGKEQAVKSLITTGPVEKIKITADRSIISKNRNDLAYLTIELTDSKGNRVPDAERKIRFMVDGEAELVAIDNGNPRDPKSFQSANVTTFHGRCLAILRPSGKAGKVTLTASCEEFPPEKCVILIK
jgi:beta-galactosidase